MDIRYIANKDAYIARNIGDGPNATGIVPKLLGARVHVDLQEEVNGWVPVTDVPPENGEPNSGFIELRHLSPTLQLKIFFVDVGQGDACLIEAESSIVIIDGGPNSGFYKYLKKRLTSLRRADRAIGLPERDHLFIDAIFVTHFDRDHYQGLVSVVKDPDFKIGTVYHNGLPRYGNSGNKDLNLGTIIRHNDGTRSISTDLSGKASIGILRNSNDFETRNGNKNNFWKFLDELKKAIDSQRVNSIKRVARRNTQPDEGSIAIGNDLQFEVLGPFTTKDQGTIRLPCFPDPHNISLTNPNPAPSESHTINGNSIVLRLSFKNVSFLFGGDLNRPAQKYLRSKYGGNLNAFRSDINKACHHGSSDFDIEYLKEVSPSATVFSSGDNGNYDHPMPDAIGAAAKHSMGEFPLVFSTELARDNLSSGKIKFGHINARSNGDMIIMAQKKESPGRSTRLWHTFSVPFEGPFGDHNF